MALVGRALRLLPLRPAFRGCSSDPAVRALQQLDLTSFRPLPPPHGALPTFARHSRALRRLLRLGVDLSFVARRSELIGFLTRADFDSDVAPVVRFLCDEFGLAPRQVAGVLTRAPAVLLKGEMVRMAGLKAYFEEVGFQKQQVAQLIAGYAEVLLMSPAELDHLFELLQQTFVLTGSELRQLVLTDPLVLSVAPNSVRVLSGTFLKSYGFNLRELHSCVLSAPRLLRTDLQRCGQNFKLLHARLGLPHAVIAANSQVLACSFRHLQERLQFLEASGRAQFDPNQPLFTAPRILALQTDEEFCAELPGVDIEQYNEFLRSL